MTGIEGKNIDDGSTITQSSDVEERKEKLIKHAVTVAGLGPSLLGTENISNQASPNATTSSVLQRNAVPPSGNTDESLTAILNKVLEKYADRLKGKENESKQLINGIVKAFTHKNDEELVNVIKKLGDTFGKELQQNTVDGILQKIDHQIKRDHSENKDTSTLEKIQRALVSLK